MANRLELAKISIAYGGQTLVREVSLKLSAGRIGCLLGPVGGGKSSVLRAIAGFEPLAQGAIHLDDARVSSPETLIPPELRGIGMVFPDCALFPHLTVGQNVAFGLYKLSGMESAKRMAEAMHQVGLRDLRDLERRYPHQLSDEQQMRVALARAIATKPRLLLLDNAFAKLEPSPRERLPTEIRDILKALDITALLATDDPREAFAMAEEIGVMSGGRLLQWGDAETLYQRPANRFVANFIGEATVLTVRVALGEGIVSEIGILPLADGGMSLRERPHVEMLLRPQQVLILPAGDSKASAGNAEILHKSYRGTDILYTLRLLASGNAILASTLTDASFNVGEKVQATLKPHTPAILNVGE